MGSRCQLRRGVASAGCGFKQSTKLPDDFGKIREKKWAGSVADDATKVAGAPRAITGHWMCGGCIGMAH